jgi:hypothetical protein
MEAEEEDLFVFNDTMEGPRARGDGSIALIFFYSYSMILFLFVFNDTLEGPRARGGRSKGSAFSSVMEGDISN